MAAARNFPGARSENGDINIKGSDTSGPSVTISILWENAIRNSKNSFSKELTHLINDFRQKLTKRGVNCPMPLLNNCCGVII